MNTTNLATLALESRAGPDQTNTYTHILASRPRHFANSMRRWALGAAASAIVLGAVGCESMDTQDRNTAIGAGVGAVGGAVLSGGSTIGTAAGAAVGGVIGHEIDTDEKDRKDQKDQKD